MPAPPLHMRAAACAAWCLLSLCWARPAQALDHFSTGWSAYVGGQDEDDRVNALAVDSGGNAYLGGRAQYVQDNAADYTTLGQPGFVAKVSPAGALLWVADFG
ncbi:MAG: SBBP repeat-containing protein, partial [Verrucomicrobiota bacterium]|nr:SBBP repeat-containing protein [Verrucomicrobiota bacterium]